MEAHNNEGKTRHEMAQKVINNKARMRERNNMSKREEENYAWTLNKKAYYIDLSCFF